MDLKDVDVDISVKASELRAKYGLKTLDAIQISTALNVNAKMFLTNDKELERVEEEKMEVMVLDNLLEV